MKFKVLGEFQMRGINFEPGNSHAKHGFTDEQVIALHNAGFVAAEGLEPPSVLVTGTEVKPDDVIITTEAV